MAHWYNFYGHDDFEPEIKVGLYDRWLSLLRSGPTQAERVLVHTPMMDLAHERRFVVSETKQSMSHFEVEHSQRVEMTINHLEACFANNSSDQLGDSVLREPKAPTGLAPMPPGSTFREIFPCVDRFLDTTMPPIEQVLELLSRIPVSEPSPADLQNETSLAVDDRENASDTLYEQWAETLREINKQSHGRPCKRPRQMRVVRVRKDILSHHVEKSHAKPQPKPARRKTYD
ncbi:hypothetical protein H2198_009332 [Neophaeococcomyces mojaviensis]|uniref:Uncharacterized protein n=1 Tax=Neophaeococcomyces mojaviensis TaxID=3383035 RepID=A0ACC2ZUS4_9EURO|nr:hypothetical protein H2198_009332 [Knufia sp. JES_112]